MTIKTFWLELLPKHEWHYEARENGPCAVNGEIHRATLPVRDYAKGEPLPGLDAPELEFCACGHKFGPFTKTGHGRSIVRRLDNGQEMRSPLPPGALYVAEEPAFCHGLDGISVVCVLPNGHHWYIDSRASNCTLPEDKEHRCWVRHGTNGGEIHVDKNGRTCAAGAGSIAVPGWHGFLHNGVLRAC